MPQRGLRQRRHHQWQAAVSLQRLWLSAHRGRTRGGCGSQAAGAAAVSGRHGGFRAIGRFLEVSHVAVYYWIKSFGKAVELVRNTATEVKVVEMDELHSYVGHKKTTAGSGRLLIDMGDGSSAALWAPATRKRGGGSGRTSSVLESKR